VDRATYNTCVADRLRGQQLTKEERRLAFCMASKICSGKCSSEEEATNVCNAPKVSKWAKGTDKEPAMSCPDRNNRILSDLEAIETALRSGETDEVKPMAARVMRDVFACHQDDGLAQMAKEAMDEVHSLTRGYFFKGEAKEAIDKINIVRAVLQ
jgi:hypothetical protein